MPDRFDVGKEGNAFDENQPQYAEVGCEVIVETGGSRTFFHASHKGTRYANSARLWTLDSPGL